MKKRTKLNTLLAIFTLQQIAEIVKNPEGSFTNTKEPQTEQTTQSTETTETNEPTKEQA